MSVFHLAVEEFQAYRSFIYWNVLWGQHYTWLVLSGAQSRKRGGRIIRRRQCKHDLPLRQQQKEISFVRQKASLKLKVINKVTEQVELILPFSNPPWTQLKNIMLHKLLRVSKTKRKEKEYVSLKPRSPGSVTFLLTTVRTGCCHLHSSLVQAG